MMPIRTLAEIKNNWNVFEGNAKDYNMFLLYSQPHNNIIQFMRENFYELDRMSGHKCFVFLIEQPPINWKDQAAQREYWQKFIFNKEVDTYLTEVIPCQRAEVYEVARHFNIRNVEIPCVVLFKNINDNEVFVYKLKNSWTSERLTLEFQRIFDILRENTFSKAMTKLALYNTGNQLDNLVRKVLAHPISEAFFKLFNLMKSGKE